MFGNVVDRPSRPSASARDGPSPRRVPLIQARQIRAAAPAGKTGTRPADRLAREPERRQPIRRSAGPRLAALRAHHLKIRKPRRKHYPHSPSPITGGCQSHDLLDGPAQIMRLSTLTPSAASGRLVPGPRAGGDCTGSSAICYLRLSLARAMNAGPRLAWLQSPVSLG